MRTIQEVLAELRYVAAKAAGGHDVSADRARLEAELKEHGLTVEARPATSRGGSRFAGPNADPAAVAALAADGGVTERGAQPGRRATAAGGSLAGAMTKALAESTPGAGGVLVPAEVSREIAEIVRARVAVTAMGPTFVGVEKELDLPYISSGATGYYVQENAPIPVSEETFALIPKLKPMELAALVPVSNRLLRDAQTNPDLESALRNDMADSLAGRQDLAFLQGLGTTEPLGIRNQSGMTPAAVDLGPNGGNITLSDLKRFVSGLRLANAPFARPGWIFSPKFLAYLDSLTDTTGRPLLDSGLLEYDSAGGGGRLLGFPFRTTSRIPTALTKGTSSDATYVIFSSDWNECWVGENLSLTIEASNEASYSPDGTTQVHAWQSRQTVYRALAAHDIALRRPEYFSCWEGVRV